MIREGKNQKVDYTIMSTKKCKTCNAPIKQNVVIRNPHACYCYVCFKLSKGKKVTRLHKVINGDKVFIREVDLIKIQKQNIKRYKN